MPPILSGDGPIGSYTTAATVTPTVNEGQGWRRVQPGALPGVWFLGNLLSMKPAPDAGFSLIEGKMSPGHAPPVHVHEQDQEAFYVLEGEVRFRCGEAEFDAGPGDAVCVTAGTPHAFRVGENGARMLMFSTSGHLAAFMTEGGEPAQAPTLPPEGSGDMARVTQIATKHDMTIIGPPLQEGPVARAS